MDQPKTQLGLRDKKPWTEVNPPKSGRQTRLAGLNHTPIKMKLTKSEAVEINTLSCAARANNQTVETG
jgi:hypothetical protein